MKSRLLVLSLFLLSLVAEAQTFTVSSPDSRIKLSVSNGQALAYNVTFDGVTMIAPSSLGFEFKDEPPMAGGFVLTCDPEIREGVECWDPVVRNKHSHIEVPYTELVLKLKEADGLYRRMDLIFRVMNDGIAFRYGLFGVSVLGNRQIVRELTSFRVPEQSVLRIPQFAYEDPEHPYKSSQEGVFLPTPVKEIKTDVHAGLPGLITVDSSHYLAILEANLDNFPAFYLGRSEESREGFQQLDIKLTPIWGEPEEGVKARFSEDQITPWRVVMVGHNPGQFIESEILRALNPDCAIDDTSWIRPGMSAWDHWWSGEILMEQPVILQYIDFAAGMGWPYMLIDWTWYGPYAEPKAIVTQPAPQLDMPEIIRYANSKGVDIWLWLRCEDANNNDQYKEAFPLFHKWGVKGVKIDFMDRDDQDMVNWYNRIIKATAENQLMLDLHGAYCPDGVDRTWPHFLTREGVMGSEYYKFADKEYKMSPEHNVTLAFTRLLAGQMDYTPGGFLNVTQEQYRVQTPTLVSNTRSAELAKFVVYESPFMCFCDHPDNVIGQVGADFVSKVPVEWDDIHFIGGEPDLYVALARRDGDKWYVGVINNSQQRQVSLDLSFLPAGSYSVEYWKDGKKANKDATSCDHGFDRFDSSKPLVVNLANAGGYVAIISNL